MTEAEFQRMVVDLILYRGLRYYHTHDSRRSNPGFPDLVIVGRSQVVYAELKSARGRLTPTQRAWIADLQRAGQTVYVWRPDDITEISLILADLARA